MLPILTDYKTNVDRIHNVSTISHDLSLMERVSTIRTQIIETGDRGLIELTKQFDHVPDGFSLTVDPSAIQSAYDKVSKEFIEALLKAKENIMTFHQYQFPKNTVHFPTSSIEYGMRYTPIQRAGMYVPGGQAAYPSTMLMDIVPAVIAGVNEIIVVTPPQSDGSVPAQTLVAADVCGIQNIFKVGGAHAIFALAYGTQTVPKVDKIVGPGNKYVTLAKQMVYGEVDIDKPAGPSEALVYVDNINYSPFAAAELLAQLEHDEDTSGVIVSASREILESVQRDLSSQFSSCKRQSILKKSLDNALLLLAENESHAIEIIDYVASEHLVLLSDDYQALFDRISHCSSVFLGPYTPVALGDYYAGPNHVLPTSGKARFSSPLGVMDFMKFCSFLKYDKDSLAGAMPHLKALTEMEGLDAHFQSVQLRLDHNSPV